MMRNIIEDDPQARIPEISYSAYCSLNRQTAFNRGAISPDTECGCFHCGSRFSGSAITDWLEEPDEEDTALCPYCGTDAVIIGLEAAPLSTALLTMLYEHWFKDELKQAEARMVYRPPFADHEDYLRKGIPFRIVQGEPEPEAIEITLFPTHKGYQPYNGTGFNKLLRVIDDPSQKNLVFIATESTPYGDEYPVFVDAKGRRIPYTPWNHIMADKVVDLHAKYGNRLRGLIMDPEFSVMKLVFIDENHELKDALL